MQNDVALAVAGDTIAAIGPTDQILKKYPNAEVYDGRGKALFPGLINCHAHLAATLARGFNEDFGFPNSARLAVQPGSLLQGEEATLMVTVGALEAIRTGTTTIVENAGGIGRYAAALAQTGLRWVFAESIRDSENVAGPMSPEGLAKSETPRFSPKLRDEGMQRINDLFTAWHGKNRDASACSPPPRSPRPRRPNCCRRVRAFAEKHDLGYTIHLIAEPRRSRVHGEAPRLRPRGVSRSSTASSARGCSRRTAATSTTPISRCWASRARSFRTRRTWPRTAASSRRFPRCARRAARSRSAPTTTPTTCSR